MAHLAFRRLRPVLDFRQQRRLRPDALMRDLLVYVGIDDEFFEQRLAFDERQLPQIIAIEIKQIESDQDDLGGATLQLILQDTEKSVVPFAAGTTTSPSMIADPAFRCQASAAIFRKRLVQSLPRRV
jgi:hypothetical protein